MNTADKIAAIVAHCKGEVSITFNEHRNNYRTVAQQISRPFYDNQFSDTELAVLAEMAARNTMVAVQCYQDTPIGFYVVYHHDLDAALDQMLATLGINEEQP